MKGLSRRKADPNLFFGKMITRFDLMAGFFIIVNGKQPLFFIGISLPFIRLHKGFA
jgi:hypothetical protein